MTTETRNYIELTHNALTEDDATGYGLVENTMDLDASNERFNEMLQAEIQRLFPGYDVTVSNGEVYATEVFTNDDEAQDDVEVWALGAHARIYGEGEFWVEEEVANAE